MIILYHMTHKENESQQKKNCEIKYLYFTKMKKKVKHIWKITPKRNMTIFNGAPKRLAMNYLLRTHNSKS